METLKSSSLLLLAFLITAALPAAVHAQSDQSGFISIDCGSPENYTDKTTGINYISDSSFIEGGTSKTISPSYKTNSVQRQLTNLRAFTQGTRNCYTLRPLQGKGNKYLIRASFLYGNYDSTSQLPTFDLHLGINYWWSVTFNDEATPKTVEIIHIPPMDYINVCLVKTGFSTPFISLLELRPLNNTDTTTYATKSGSLQLFLRYNFDSDQTTQSVRYKDDLFDRIWFPFTLSNVTTLSTVSNIRYNSYQLPSAVMASAITPLNASEALQFYWDTKNTSEEYYLYFHFAEVVQLQANQSRKFSIYLNDDIFIEDVKTYYLGANTVYSRSPESGRSRYLFSLNKTGTSTHPPIINALEIYTVKQFPNMETDETDVSAMLKIKSMYGITKNWQGDPCAPQAFVWDGLNCSYDGFQQPRITSLYGNHLGNLSASGLYGVIAPSISDLTTIQSLDLSNNNLTGQVPDFLSLMTSLKTINLMGNSFTGSIPAQLLDKANRGLLSLSIEGMDNTTDACTSDSCKKKKNRILVPVVASVTAVSFVVCTALVTLWMIKRRKQQGRKVDTQSNKNEGKLVGKNRQFTYSEVLSITNNFNKVIGRGGFGTVYYGYVGDTQVAVKMLSPSSTQGYREFQAEASLLMSVHHKNLSTLIGYCNEGTSMGIIYEYMPNGNLDQHLSDSNLYTLGWEERVRIATDAAQGLEYLHHGCKPPIVHRDVKSNNILLNEKFRAKLTDFGLSRAFSVEGDTHVSTIVAGTPGYLDPEYYISNRLTEKSDVYGFGIVLLEIITGRPAIAKTEDRTHIIQWVTTTLKNGDVSNIVDPRLNGDFDINSAWKVMELAMACGSRVSSKRPTMKEVVLELNGCLETEMGLRQNEDVAAYKESIALISVNIEESGLAPTAR